MENAFAIAIQFTLYKTIYLINCFCATTFNSSSIRSYFDFWAFERRPLWRSPASENEQVKPVTQVYLYTSTYCLGKQESPALFGWAQFLLDGGRSERRQCGAPGSQSSAGCSVTSCEASNSNADEGGRYDRNCPVFSNNPLGWIKVSSSGFI